MIGILQNTSTPLPIVNRWKHLLQINQFAVVTLCDDDIQAYEYCTALIVGDRDSLVQIDTESDCVVCFPLSGSETSQERTWLLNHGADTLFPPLPSIENENSPKYLYFRYAEMYAEQVLELSLRRAAETVLLSGSAVWLPQSQVVVGSAGVKGVRAFDGKVLDLIAQGNGRITSRMIAQTLKSTQHSVNNAISRLRKVLRTFDDVTIECRRRSRRENGVYRITTLLA